jgi:hypothetical protein
LLDVFADLVPGFLSEPSGYCCGVAKSGCTASGSPERARLALEICLDETGLWVESRGGGSKVTSGAEGLIGQVLGQSNVSARNAKRSLDMPLTL